MENNNMNKLYIVNEFDRPYERLIAQEIGGKLYYVHPDIRSEKQYHGMSIENATPVEDYGLKIVLEDGYLCGEVVSESKVKYSTGGIRKWQGSNKFRIKMV